MAVDVGNHMTYIYRDSLAASYKSILMQLKYLGWKILGWIMSFSCARALIQLMVLLGEKWIMLFNNSTNASSVP